MRYITPRNMIGFCSELQKEAGISQLFRKYLAGKYGRQIALGAGAGAVGGAATADEGENRIGRALRGAMWGAGLGAGSVLARKGGRAWVGTGAKNFGKRQLYGLTGRGVKDVDEARRIGLIPKRQAVEGPVRNVAKNVKAQQMDKLHEHAFQQGYTSVPGVLYGLATKPGDIIHTGWKRGGGLGKLMAGAGAYGAIKGAVEKPEEGGPGRAEKALRGAGSTLGWLVAPEGMLGGMAVGEGIGAMTGKAGKVLDRQVAAGRAQARQQMRPSYYARAAYRR
jgi:hypothetical protein